jgi:hypothetical protein
VILWRKKFLGNILVPSRFERLIKMDKSAERSVRDLNPGHRRSPNESLERFSGCSSEHKTVVSSTRAFHLLRGRHPWPLD